MWECSNCQEEIEDRYEHCWNCGKPKAETRRVLSSAKIRPEAEPPPAERSAPENEPQTEKILPPENDVPPKEKIRSKEAFLFENEYSGQERPTSKISSVVLPFLWLAAAGAVAYFAYYSNQKTAAFENRIAEESKNLSGQANQFVFSKDAPREKNAKVKAKVLPLSAKNRQLDGLYKYLPDDLRPANLDEVRTLLWLDCNPKEVWRYDDGSPGFRESCNAYLVDRETSKIIQIEEFPGAMPPLKKSAESGGDTGKVLPEVYISYIKANQAAQERSPSGVSSDSPEHHIRFKSELLYAFILLGLLGAVGVGWIIYKIKSAFRKTE